MWHGGAVEQHDQHALLAGQRAQVEREVCELGVGNGAAGVVAD